MGLPRINQVFYWPLRLYFQILDRSPLLYVKGVRINPTDIKKPTLFGTGEICSIQKLC